MGTSPSRREPEVHVVVVQSQENGKMNAKVIRQAYSKTITHDTDADKEDKRGTQQNKPSRRTPPTHLAFPSDEPSPGFHEHSRHLSDGSVVTSSSYQELYQPMDYLTTATTRDTPEFPRRASEGTLMEYHKKQTRRGIGLSSQERHLQNKPYHQLQHYTGMPITYSTATMESVADRETPHTPERRGGGVMRKEVSNGELSPASEKGGSTSMFELFRTHKGEEFTVYVRDDGKRFYVDFEEQKWRYFPESWSERGYFLPIDYDPYQVHRYDDAAGNQKQFTDVREGEFIHPTRGKLVTYLRQESSNVLYFFDEGTGSWLPMPLSWERHVPGVTTMIADIQKSCPEWRDAKSIVAMLRCCKYSVDECVSAYKSINDDGVLDYSDGGPVGRDPFRNLTENKLKETTSKLKDVKERNKEMKNHLEQLQNKVEELEIENERMKKEIENGKQEQRRQSKMFRQQSLSQSFRVIKPAVIRPLLTILGEDSRALRAKVTALRNVAVKGLRSFSSSMDQLSKALGQLLRIHRHQKQEIQEVRTLYQKEALQRKLLYNEVQELRGNIRVFCRCRYDNSDRCHLRFDDADRVVCTTQQGRKKLFEFERVYTPDTTQEKVFEDTKPIITSCVDGYNVCIIAYGQTGAGKTYTMMGRREAYGVNIRSMKELFKICRERTKVKYRMKVSMVEVYNESVYDVLASSDEGHQKLQLQNKGKNVSVPGLIEIEVRTMEDVLMVFKEGEKNRTVACTKMNTNSSRSHLLFFLKVEGYDIVSKATSRGRLTLVDLAGSERLSRSEASGIRLVEAAAINKSLSALGQVFASIRSGALHIPYRNSKLTHLLQPCIGGDSKACMFVNISPLESNVMETISTLEFGQNARQVELGKATKHVSRGPPL